MPKLRRTAAAVPLFLALLVAQAAPAEAQTPVQFDVTPTFNADVIVNDSAAGPLDAVNDPIDSPATSNMALITNAAGTTLGCATVVDLPDNGFFPGNADHPDVQLAYSNESDGLNARRSPSADTYTFFVPSNNYTNVHVFFTAGEAGGSPPAVTVALIYQSGPQTVANITVPDWFVDPSPGLSYALFDGGDRANATAPANCDDVNTVAVFGFNIAAEPTQTLNSVSITRTDTGGAILSFFGATGVLVIPVELQGFTVE